MAETLKVAIERTDGSTDSFPILPKTMVAFERQFHCGIGVLSNDETRRMEYIYWLAWDAERTAGKVVKPFDEWLDTIAWVMAENVRPDPLGSSASPTV